MSCNYYHGKCVFLNGKEDGCIACPIKRAYNKGVRDTKKDYRPQGEWKHIIEEDNDVECPFCGFQEDGIYYNFCPRCGARLKVKGD